MLRFNNDYNQGCHPAILKALEETNNTAYPGYGTDEICEKAASEIKKYLGSANADIHFLVGGTQVNYVLIQSALRPYQSVISADSGHINVHESGAVENTGHKIETSPNKDGKITAEQIAAHAEGFLASGIKEHITQPKLVYISFPTEYGTIYSKAELTEISRTCKKYGFYLFMDGARMGYGLGCSENDLTLSDIAALTDAFTIGGTKCGALFGEALVITNDALKPDFRNFMKMTGAMLAKGWLIGLQFYTLFKDGLYFEITKKASDQALLIKEAFRNRGFEFYVESPTNQQFVIVNQSQMDALAENYYFEYEADLGGGRHCIRFCTSWATPQENIAALVKDIERLGV